MINRTKKQTVEIININYIPLKLQMTVSSCGGCRR